MDIKSLMKQAQQMQDKMKKIQDDFSSKEFTGSAGGGSGGNAAGGVRIIYGIGAGTTKTYPNTSD